MWSHCHVCGVNKRGHQWRSVPFMMKKKEESLPWVAGDISYQMSTLIFHYGEVGK